MNTFVINERLKWSIRDAGLTVQQWQGAGLRVCLWVLDQDPLTDWPLQPSERHRSFLQQRIIFKRTSLSNSDHLSQQSAVLGERVPACLFYSSCSTHRSRWVISDFALQISTLRRQGRTLYPTVPENAEREAQSLFVQEVSWLKGSPPKNPKIDFPSAWSTFLLI